VIFNDYAGNELICLVDAAEDGGGSPLKNTAAAVRSTAAR
jgi:hypothetical protein